MKFLWKLSVAPLLVVGLNQSTFGQEAASFQVRPANSQQIRIKKDHFSVSLIRGWISSNDGFFQSILSKKDKLVISIKASSSFFDGASNDFAFVLENTDIAKKTDRPWGTSKLLLDRIPADCSSSIDLKAAVDRKGRLTAIFDAIKSNEPTGVAIDSIPWFGYSKLVAGVVTAAFGATKSSYPFKWAGDIKVGSVVTPDTISEHYLILISPAKDGDNFPNTLDGSKLSWDETQQQLVYNGQVVKDHSYAVLKISKAGQYDIPSLIFESTAPWSVLAVSQFFAPGAVDVEDGNQVAKLSRSVTDQLKIELDLLKKEHRFSAFDRAAALYSFSDRSKSVIQRLCKQKNIPDAKCDTSDLENFQGSILAFFNLPQSDLQDVQANAGKITKTVLLQMNMQ